ncbi:MAG: cytochrome c family protein [Limisphaerales bacterium]
MKRLLPRPAPALLLLAALLPAASLPGADAPARFTGSPSCATSMCHGGAGELRHQTTIWQKQDIHSRTFNTLVNARSAQIAAALKIPDATTSSRCTTCHAPFHDVPKSAFLAEITKPAEGVSCESCHGPAEKWIRPHTRPDYSHRDRVLAGLRDLKHLYVRANSCVACHQTVDPALLSAGHPELLFELDGQAVSEPKHWREKGDWHGPKAWLVGQAVALREMSAQLNREKTPGEKLTAPWAASLWLLQKLDGIDSALPTLKSVANAAQAHPAADTLARRAAEMEWSHDLTRQALQRLAKTHTEFADAKITRLQQARRAERLVLALDRLTAPLDKAALAKLEPDLKELFAIAQSLPDFAPDKFAKALESFARKL